MKILPRHGFEANEEGVEKMLVSFKSLAKDAWFCQEILRIATGSWWYFKRKPIVFGCHGRLLQQNVKILH